MFFNLLDPSISDHCNTRSVKSLLSQINELKASMEKKNQELLSLSSICKSQFNSLIEDFQTSYNPLFQKSPYKSLLPKLVTRTFIFCPDCNDFFIKKVNNSQCPLCNNNDCFYSEIIFNVPQFHMYKEYIQPIEKE